MKVLMGIIMLWVVGLMIFWTVCRLTGLSMDDFVNRAIAKHPEMKNDKETVTIYKGIAWTFVPFLMPFLPIVVLIEQIGSKFGGDR